MADCHAKYELGDQYKWYTPIPRLFAVSDEYSSPIAISPQLISYHENERVGVRVTSVKLATSSERSPSVTSSLAFENISVCRVHLSERCGRTSSSRSVSVNISPIDHGTLKDSAKLIEAPPTLSENVRVSRIRSRRHSIDQDNYLLHGFNESPDTPDTLNKDYPRNLGRTQSTSSVTVRVSRIKSNKSSRSLTSSLSVYRHSLENCSIKSVGVRTVKAPPFMKTTSITLTDPLISTISGVTKRPTTDEKTVGPAMATVHVRHVRKIHEYPTVDANVSQIGTISLDDDLQKSRISRHSNLSSRRTPSIRVEHVSKTKSVDGKLTNNNDDVSRAHHSASAQNVVYC